MVRVAITFVFTLMISATAWAGNWNQPVNKNIDASAIRKALAEDGLGLLRFEIPFPLISPTAKAPVSISEKSFLGKKSINFNFIMAIVERKNILVIVRMTGRELNYSLKKRAPIKRSGIVL